MTFTPSQIHAFHRALHLACELPPLRPSMSDERAWWDFLIEMAPLDEDESGPFSIADLEGAVRQMKWEKREGKAGWAIRPSSILKSPESFRDLVLGFRVHRRKQRLSSRHHAPLKVPPACPDVDILHTDEEIVSPEELSASIARMRHALESQRKYCTCSINQPTRRISETLYCDTCKFPIRDVTEGGAA